MKKTGMVRKLEKDKKYLQERVNVLELDKKYLQERVNVLELDKDGFQERVNVLERDKDGLQKGIDNLLEDNKNFNYQVTDLIRENEKLLKEKSEIVGFSLNNTNIRGLSTDAGKPEILKYILENIKKDEKILDVGFGSGVYGKLLRTFYYNNIDGLDVYGKHIKKMGLDKIYNNIFIENIIDFDFDFYDLIILGDVLEHLELKSAKKLLSGFINENKCDHIIVSIPFEYEQDEVKGNKYEKHLQPDVNEEYMKEHFPFLILFNSQIIPNHGSIIATYIWNKI